MRISDWSSDVCSSELPPAEGLAVSVAAPARVRPGSRSVVEARPLRNPDAASRQVMTRRGWWLVIMNFLLPGSAQVLAGNRRLGRFGLGATLVMWVLLVDRKSTRLNSSH